MFIDCTGLSIRLDPTQYPSGIVIQLYAVTLPGQERVGSVVSETGYELEPKFREPIPLNGFRGDRCVYSLTEHWEHTVFAEETGEEFGVRCYYLNIDNILVIRDFSFDIVDRPDDGWVLEIEDNQGTGNSVSIALRDFHPEAVVRLKEEPDEAKAEEKPPGRPLWERLDEDD